MSDTRRRVLARRLARGSSLLVALLFAAHSLWDFVEARRWNNLLVTLRQSGGPVTYADLQARTETPPEADDGSRFLVASLGVVTVDRAEIAAVRALIRSRAGRELSADLVPAARPILERHQAAFDLVDRASRSQSGSLLRSWHALVGDQSLADRAPTMLPLERVRNLSSLLSLRGADALAGGRPDVALASLKGALHLQQAMQSDPPALSQIIAMSVLDRACQDLARLFGAGGIDAAGRDEVEGYLRRAELNRSAEFFLGERAYAVAHGPSYQVAGGWLSRPMLRRQVTQLVADQSAYVEAALRPWPERVRAVEEVQAAHTRGPGRILSRIVLPSLARAAVTEAETTTLLRASLLALAVERHRARAGDLLLDATVLGTVPIDPFTGAALRYQRELDGYVVYGTGRDGRDDGGQVDFTPDGERKDVGLRISTSHPTVPNTH